METLEELRVRIIAGAIANQAAGFAGRGKRAA